MQSPYHRTNVHSLSGQERRLSAGRLDSLGLWGHTGAPILDSQNFCSSVPEEQKDGHVKLLDGASKQS